MSGRVRRNSTTVARGNLACTIGESGESGGSGLSVSTMAKRGVDSKGTDNPEVLNLTVNCCMAHGGMLHTASKSIDSNHSPRPSPGGDLGCPETTCEAMVVPWW